MSGKVSGAIWDLELKGVKQLVLLAMADHADHQGENVRPSIGLIAWKTGYSERQVQRTIKTLVGDGLLVKQDEPPGRPVIYRIDVDAGIKKQPYHTKNVTPDIAMSPLTPECHPQVGLPDVTPRGDTQMSPEPSLQPSEQTSSKEQKDSTVSVEPVPAATQKTEKSSKRKAKSEDPETNIAIGALIKAWVDATGTLEANPYKKTGYRATAKTMHAAGITPEDVTAFVQFKKKEKWYADKIVKLGDVAQNISAWKASVPPAEPEPAPPLSPARKAQLDQWSKEQTAKIAAFMKAHPGQSLPFELQSGRLPPPIDLEKAS